MADSNGINWPFKGVHFTPSIFIFIFSSASKNSSKKLRPFPFRIEKMIPFPQIMQNALTMGVLFSLWFAASSLLLFSCFIHIRHIIDDRLFSARTFAILQVNIGLFFIFAPLPFLSDCEPSSSFFNFIRFLCSIDELLWAIKLRETCSLFPL